VLVISKHYQQRVLASRACERMLKPTFVTPALRTAHSPLPLMLFSIHSAPFLEIVVFKCQVQVV